MAPTDRMIAVVVVDSRATAVNPAGRKEHLGDCDLIAGRWGRDDHTGRGQRDGLLLRRSGGLNQHAKRRPVGKQALLPGRAWFLRVRQASRGRLSPGRRSYLARHRTCANEDQIPTTKLPSNVGVEPVPVQTKVISALPLVAKTGADADVPPVLVNTPTQVIV